MSQMAEAEMNSTTTKQVLSSKDTIGKLKMKKTNDWHRYEHTDETEGTSHPLAKLVRGYNHTI